MADGNKYPIPEDWQRFQRLIYSIYEKKYPGCIVDEYGRRGQKQSGIDTFVQQPSGKIIAIQCKHKSDIANGKITPDDIDKELEKTKNYDVT